MLTNKNSARGHAGGWTKRTGGVFAAVTILFLAGCQPAGPKSLLLGEKYIQQREYEKALKQLTRASVLIPEQPQVWNHLGLAYHGLGQPVKAADAYQRSLRIDRNQAAPHYNLGVLYLEQEHYPQAAAELNAYVQMRTNEVQGFVKLGTALLRMRQSDQAERVLIHALRLDPKNADAHNLLGLAHVQRKRPIDAMNSFNDALRVRPTYAAAVLNQAIVAHSYFANRDLALERYRTYLTTGPDHKTEARVQVAIRSIERELAGTKVAIAEPETNRFSNLGKTNLATTATNAVSSPATNLATVSTNVVPARTNVVAQTTNNPSATTAATNIAQAVRTNLTTSGTNLAQARAAQKATNTVASTNLIVAASTNKPAEPRAVPSTNETAVANDEEPEPLSVEVVKVEEPTLRTAQDVEVNIAAASTRTNAVVEEKPLFAPRKSDEKSGVLSRVNPMRWFRDDEKERSGEGVDESSKARSAPRQTIPVPPARPSYPPVVKQTNPEPERPRVIQRYQYRKKVPLVAGNRAEAEKYFRRGAEAHQARLTLEAVEFYRQATLIDPTYFEAHYNLALAAYQRKNLPLALAENELAVVANPKSADARFNFALTLKEANYPADAAAELKTLVAQNPDELRAHLVLATLYADHLDEPALAKRHYQAVLELNPAHPDAPGIRQWLAAHP